METKFIDLATMGDWVQNRSTTMGQLFSVKFIKNSRKLITSTRKSEAPARMLVYILGEVVSVAMDVPKMCFVRLLGAQVTDG